MVSDQGGALASWGNRLAWSSDPVRWASGQRCCCEGAAQDWTSPQDARLSAPGRAFQHLYPGCPVGLKSTHRAAIPEDAPDQAQGSSVISGTSIKESTETEVQPEPALKVHGVRLMELTDRDSGVIKVSKIDEYAPWDSVINTFRAFGQWRDIAIMAGVSVVPKYSYADTIVGMARDESTDLLLIPWSETGGMSEVRTGLGIDEASRFVNGPYDNFVSQCSLVYDEECGRLVERSIYSRRSGKQWPQLTRTVSALSSRSSIWGATPAAARSHHIVLPFFGGDDDRFASNSSFSSLKTMR